VRYRCLYILHGDHISDSRILLFFYTYTDILRMSTQNIFTPANVIISLIIIWYSFQYFWQKISKYTINSGQNLGMDYKFASLAFKNTTGIHMRVTISLSVMRTYSELWSHIHWSKITLDYADFIGKKCMSFCNLAVVSSIRYRPIGKIWQWANAKKVIGSPWCQLDCY
jgi:hypothetical protein